MELQDNPEKLKQFDELLHQCHAGKARTTTITSEFDEEIDNEHQKESSHS